MGLDFWVALFIFVFFYFLIYCTVSWWSLFLRSQLLLSAPMASGSPVWDEELCLTILLDETVCSLLAMEEYF